MGYTLIFRENLSKLNIFHWALCHFLAASVQVRKKKKEIIYHSIELKQTLQTLNYKSKLLSAVKNVSNGQFKQ